MENHSLFNLEVNSGKKLPVVFAKFCDVANVDVDDLFNGFDNISAITFSSNIDFIKKILRKFKKDELIFGCERILSGSIQEVFAYQSKLIERLQKKQFEERICSVFCF